MAMKAVVIVMMIAMASENLAENFFFSLLAILDPQWHFGPH